VSSINSLVGPAPTTFTRSHGPTNTWLDKYIDNPDYRPSTWFDKYNDPNLSDQSYNTLELRPGMTTAAEPIPNYNPDNDLGYTKMARAIDPEWLKIIGLLTGQVG